MTLEWQAALAAGDVERLRSLLDGGADIDALDRYGQTGLMQAAVRGRAEVAELLIERGAALDHTAKYKLSATVVGSAVGRVTRHVHERGGHVREMVAATVSSEETNREFLRGVLTELPSSLAGPAAWWLNDLVVEKSEKMRRIGRTHASE